MTHAFLAWGTLALCWAMSCSTSFAQNPASQSTQSASDAPTATPSQPQTTASAALAETKKPKKVWTNDDVNSLSAPISVVGNTKSAAKPVSDAKADPQYIANTRKQLEKLQSQLDDTDKQLADLQDFSEGKSASTSGGYQINKGYNRVPVDQQISNLEAKKEQLQGKIDALLDEARRKGVQPGDLR